MRPSPTDANGDTDVDAGGSERSAATLFAIVWDALAAVLGTAGVAAIVRRAAGRAAVESPELVDLVVSRDEIEYHYKLPSGWSRPAEQAPIALRVLVAEIGRSLVELTGTVVIRRLEELPALRSCGLMWREEQAN